MNSRFLQFILLPVLLFNVSCRQDEETANLGKHDFNIPTGNAVDSIKMVSEQAEIEFIFSVEELEDITTQAIQGRLTTEEAFKQMTLNTPLEITYSKKHNAYSIKRISSGEAVNIAEH